MLDNRNGLKQRSLFDKTQKSLFNCESDLGAAVFLMPKPPVPPDETESGKQDIRPPLPLVVPDRQEPIDLGDIELRPRRDERNAICVDRLRADIDGPPHRFTIRLGDYVEVFFPPDVIGIGEVVDVACAEQEVRVAFYVEDDGEWFPVEVIFPCPSFDRSRAEDLAWTKLPTVTWAEASTPEAYQIKLFQRESQLAALARLKRLEESLTQGVPLESFIAEEGAIEPPELPTRRIFAIDEKEVYDWFVSMTPGHYIDACDDCPDGAPVVIGWEDDECAFVRQLTRKEAHRLQKACNAAHGDWDRQSDK